MKRTAAFLSAVAIAASLIATAPAAAASPTSGIDLEARAAQAREIVADDREVRAAATVDTAAVGDCGDARATDPDEGMFIDIGASVALADCDGTIGAGIDTYDAWFDDELDFAAVSLDTDRNSSTGCFGFDYTIIVINESASFPGVIFEESAACDTGNEVGAATGVRTEDPYFLAIFWNAASIGSPPAFAFTTATKSIYSEDIDFAPNPGATQPVLTITGAEPPRPQPQARPTDDSCPPGEIPAAGFTDVSSTNVHRAAVDCVVHWGVAQGLSARSYGPARDVTRAQMASFIARMIESVGADLPTQTADHFGDDNGNPHEANINKLAEVGVVSGKTSSSYAPSDPVNRAQMATFIARAVAYVTGELLPDAPGDYFADDETQGAHEDNINRAAAAGITTGVSGSNYQPRASVKRDQMASFLARTLDYLVEATGAPVP